MKKFTVAVCNLYTSKNEVKLVMAENEFDAVIIAVEGELIEIEYVESVEDLQGYYYDGELSVSAPLELK